MIGTENQYLIYDESTFNCPLCACVHWPKDWRYKWKEHGDGVEFEIRCVNRKCRVRLMLIAQGEIIKVTTMAWYEAFTKNKKPKRDYNNLNNKNKGK